PTRVQRPSRPRPKLPPAETLTPRPALSPLPTPQPVLTPPPPAPSPVDQAPVSVQPAISASAPVTVPVVTGTVAVPVRTTAVVLATRADVEKADEVDHGKKAHGHGDHHANVPTSSQPTPASEPLEELSTPAPVDDETSAEASPPGHARKDGADPEKTNAG